MSPVKTNLFIYIFIYLHIYLLLVLLFATYNALCTSISFLIGKGFSFSGLFQNLNFCHVKCLCQILFMLTRYLNTSWPLLPITLGFTMNGRQKLVSVACMCPGKRNSCVRTSYHVSKMLHHTGSAIRTLIN